jgi:transcription initiation factor IIF auxiliary subunit
MTHTVKLTPKDLISKRERLISDIKRNWSRIKAFNAVDKGQTRDYDMNAVYKSIITDSIELVKVKVAIQAINMGLSKMSDLPKDNLYTQIYMLQQLKEQKTKLLMTPYKGEDIVFSKQFIQSEAKKIDIEISKIEDQLEKRNSEISFAL